MFISFEGCDGSGKSTQLRLCARRLRRLGYKVLTTREPGGSAGAEEIRRLILSGDADRWSAETEVLLFMAARRDHIEKVVRPALARGEIVLSDRYVDSTRVYQGVARADLRGLVDSLHELVIGMDTDMTVVLDLDARTALARANHRIGSATSDAGEDESRFEAFGLSFQGRVREGFAALPDQYPDRCQRIPAEGNIRQVNRRVMAAIRQRLDARLCHITLPGNDGPKNDGASLAAR